MTIHQQTAVPEHAPPPAPDSGRAAIRAQNILIALIFFATALNYGRPAGAGAAQADAGSGVPLGRPAVRASRLNLPAGGGGFAARRGLVRRSFRRALRLRFRRGLVGAAVRIQARRQACSSWTAHPKVGDTLPVLRQLLPDSDARIDWSGVAGTTFPQRRSFHVTVAKCWRRQSRICAALPAPHCRDAAAQISSFFFTSKTSMMRAPLCGPSHTNCHLPSL